MSSRRTSRAERAAHENLGNTRMRSVIERRSPRTDPIRAGYSWAMGLVMWVGVDPRRVRWDETQSEARP
jgi:hypothetical protein